MQHHPTISQLALFCARELVVPELACIAEHLAQCQECRQNLRDIVQQRRGNKPVAFSLSETEWFRDAHFDYEQLVALAEETLDETNASIISIHLETCSRCKAAVNDFLAHRQQLETEMKSRGLSNEVLSKL